MADQTVIVTGAAKGIGFGISEKFCEAGYDTIMLGLRVVKKNLH